MCTLPFGLSSAPEAFTRLTKTMVRRWRSRGWIVRHCLDDVGFLAETKEGAEAMIRQAFADVSELGFGCNLAKCETVGSNFIRFLGLIVDLRTAPRFWIPEQRKTKLVTKMEGSLEEVFPSFSSIASIVGSLVSPVLGRDATRYTKGLLQMLVPVYAMGKSGWKQRTAGPTGRRRRSGSGWASSAPSRSAVSAR